MAFNPPPKMTAMATAAGTYKANLSVLQLLMRGLYGGAYIAIGAALCTVCATGVAAHLGPGIGKLIGGAVFPVGLIAIVVTGVELFTGDCMLVPLAAMMKKVSMGMVFKNWGCVYIGNLIGSLWYAYLMAVGPLVSGHVDGSLAVNAFGMTAINIAVAKTLTYKAVGAAGMWSAFMKAIGCNFLVNIAILMAICSDDVIGKFFGIWFPIMAFVSSGFEHCVANMYFLPAGIFLNHWHPETTAKIGGLLQHFGGLTWVDMWLWNELPVTIGNIFGGFFFIGAMYYFFYRKEVPKG